MVAMKLIASTGAIAAPACVFGLSINPTNMVKTNAKAKGSKATGEKMCQTNGYEQYSYCVDVELNVMGQAIDMDGLGLMDNDCYFVGFTR